MPCAVPKPSIGQRIGILEADPGSAPTRRIEPLARRNYGRRLRLGCERARSCWRPCTQVLFAAGFPRSCIASDKCVRARGLQRRVPWTNQRNAPSERPRPSRHSGHTRRYRPPTGRQTAGPVAHSRSSTPGRGISHVRPPDLPDLQATGAGICWSFSYRGLPGMSAARATSPGRGVRTAAAASPEQRRTAPGAMGAASG